jgi:putative membrane protein
MINAVALWLSDWLLSGVSFSGSILALVLAAVLLSLINATLKPIVTILALPAILISLGLFSLVVNGLMVYLTSAIIGPFVISSIAMAILAGIVVSLINYALTAYFEEKIFKE